MNATQRTVLVLPILLALHGCVSEQAIGHVASNLMNELWGAEGESFDAAGRLMD